MLTSPLHLLAGDTFFLRSQSSKLETLNFTARFSDRKLKNQWDQALATHATTDDRLIAQSTFRLESDTDLIWLKCSDQLEANIQRGETFIEVYITKGGTKPFYTLIGDYLYTDNYPQWPGEIVDRNSGRGFLSWVSLAANIAPVDVTRVLAATNAFRRIHGFVWHYKASGDAATRTIVASLRQPGLALPTGMPVRNSWVSATKTITVNEDGTIYARGRFGFSDDTGTGSFDNAATNPTPFPFDVTEDELTDLFFDVGAAEAADRHSIYLLQEEWLSI